MTGKEYGFHTKCTHAGYEADATHSVQAPLHMTTAYTFDSTEDARAVFALEKPANIYSRLGSPTCDILEKRIAALDGGVAALCASSGHAAMLMTFMCLCASGDEIVSASRIYGGAVNMMSKTLRQMGITVRFADIDRPESFAEATNGRTRAWFAETLGNPASDVPDLRALADAAHSFGLPLIADNTVATPYLLRPAEHGADITVYSASKYLCAHGTVIAGLVADSGLFCFKGNPRFPDFNTPDASYHGLVYADLGPAAFVTKLRAHILRDTGMTLSPFNAWLVLLGMETLPLRMERHSASALAVAEYLEKHPKIESVSYCGLKSSRYYPLAMRYMPKGQSSMFTFDIKGSAESGGRFCDSLRLLKIVTNLGDSRTLVSCPAATTHSQLSAEQLSSQGIKPGTIRISVGLEDTEDIIDDIASALAAV
ncbi:MAG: O-acetylhomoserine aminocarboxypropyltransferase/cysteine synthase [Oscillospiraceae bacterium]|jgi:O-acetylhomoserine (thiol)-lyase|nr:O-acetylhomoserine aminocarboxypropyltransferase/cysteine synthase [Oscillospiraceae bacterium]